MRYFFSILLYVVALFILLSLIYGIKELKTETDPKKKKDTKAGIVTGVIIVIVAFFGGKALWPSSGGSHDSKAVVTNSISNTANVPKDKSEANTKDKSNQETKANEEAASKAKAEADAAEQKTKQEAEQALNDFTKVTDEFNSVYNDFQKVVTGLTNGSEDPVNAYSELSQINDDALNVFNDAESLDVPDRYTDSKESLTIATSSLQNSIKEFQSYLDDKKVSTMSKATDDLKLAQQGIQTTNAAVAEQVLKDGYTPPSSNK